MYSRETRVLLRHYLEQGVGKTELARRFGVSRRTVYHWIQTEQLDRDLDGTPSELSAPYGGAGLRGDSSGRLRRRLHADQRVCP
jgi:transposase-like protein